MANDKNAGAGTATKVKQVRNLGPRFMHFGFKVTDAEGNAIPGAKLSDFGIVTNMEALVEALGQGKTYGKVQLPTRTPRAKKDAAA